MAALARAVPGRLGPRSPARAPPASPTVRWTILVDQADEEAADRGRDEARTSKLWMHQVKHLRASSTAARRAEQVGAERRSAVRDRPRRRLWARVTQTRAETRGEGDPIPHWTDRDGQFTHSPRPRPRHDVPGRPPARRVSARLRADSRPGREIRVAYGGLAVGPKADLKHWSGRSSAGRSPDLPLNPPLEKLGEWYPFRLASKGGG